MPDMPTLGHLVRCLNRACSGPEIFQFFKGARPQESIPCPACGWLCSPAEMLIVRDEGEGPRTVLESILGGD